MKARLLTIASALLLLSCNEQSNQTISETKPADTTQSTATPVAVVDTAHNSQNSLDWSGTYKGILPCSGCDGIETEITLSKDMNYLRLTKYLGKKNAMVGELRGKFTWNEEKSLVNLEGVEDGPSQFKVGENTLTQLDMKGNEISGANADKYILRK